MLNRLLNSTLRLSADEAAFARRGFGASNSKKQHHLEEVGRTFIRGYNKALDSRGLPELTAALEEVGPQYRGFAYEGAGMALALTDHLWIWNTSQWLPFMTGPGKAHHYMLFVGYGWAVARLPWLRSTLSRTLARFDTVLKWLIVDGYGFHQGYFDPLSCIVGRQRPRRLTAGEARVFDQGLGRSIWFYGGAEPERVASLVNTFPEPRRCDLWSGVGLAATYAGAIDLAELRALARYSAAYKAHVTQGAAFAAEARVRAGINTEHTDAAAHVFCRSDAQAAAIATRFAFQDADGSSFQAYEEWRSRIRRLLEPAPFSVDAHAAAG